MRRRATAPPAHAPRSPRPSSLLLLASLAGLLPAAAAAQPLLLARLDFSLSNPGARSLGFGGAFAALADDATAAYANPAGLVQLTKPEVSAEVRQWQQTPAFISGGRIEGEPSGQGLDTRRDLALERSSREEIGPSFASVVLPRGRFTFALYGHRLADFGSESESQGFFFSDEEEPGASLRFPASRERAALEATSAGVAAGFRANDRLSLGLSVVYTDLSLATRSAFFLPDDERAASQFDTIHFLPERLLSQNTLTVEDEDVTVSAGLLWQFVDQLALGLFYRQGASGSGRVDFEFRPAAFPQDGEPAARFSNPARFNVPDVTGAGLAFRSRDGRFTVAAEAQYLTYENLIAVEDTEDLIVVGRDYLNAWEVHLGAEYALPRGSSLFALRAGVWLDEDGDALVGDDVLHASAGFGYAGPLLQVDLAADLSSTDDTLALSFIYTF